jgi:hypothetical protein
MMNAEEGLIGVYQRPISLFQQSLQACATNRRDRSLWSRLGEFVHFTRRRFRAATAGSDLPDLFSNPYSLDCTRHITDLRDLADPRSYPFSFLERL